jgi:pyridoxine 5'-phosphate synthase PdxJ
MKLGVNIDHIATLRNARGQDNPNIIRALKICQDAKIDTLTVHLREDRRHIKDKDLFELKKYSKIPINLEMALTELHTGNLDKKIIRKSTINQINEMIVYAHSKKLIVNVGHGLNFKNIKFIKKRKYVDTVHVGHFIISEAIFISLTKTINIFRNLIKK